MTACSNASAPRGLARPLLPALAILLVAASWARADEVPSLQKGLWEYQTTSGTQSATVTECIDPSEQLRREQAGLARMGCKLAPVQHEGATYTYIADCSIKLPAGAMTSRTVSYHKVSELTTSSDSAFRIETRVTEQGETTNESITARRVADCSK